jgi:hypothetical protein
VQLRRYIHVVHLGSETRSRLAELNHTHHSS